MITSELLMAIGKNLLTPVRLEAIREQMERVQGLYARASELGYFLSHQHPTPAAHDAQVDGHCGECSKMRTFDVRVTMGMFEAWLDELEKQCAAIVQGAEKRACAELEQSAPPKRKKRKPTMTDEEIEESLAVCDRATAAPWRGGTKVGRTLYCGDVLIGVLDKSVDVAFAARARVDLPRALLALQQARRELAALHAHVDKAIEMIDASRAKP